MVFSELRARTWMKQESLFLELLEAKDPNNDLYEAARYQVQSGGKRLRAVLPVVVQGALSQAWSRSGEADLERAIWSGLAVEVLHSATLCHDDVMDGDRVRRDQPTVWVNHGIPQAINAGDLLFFVARDALSKAPFSDAAKLKALSLLSEKIAFVIEGQGLETTLLRHHRAPDPESYARIAEGKTGGLFSLCLVLGALSCEAEVSILETLDRVGAELGWVFQVQDDLIDLIGEKGRGEKGNDLREGKPSWLVADACARMNEPLRQRFLERLYKARESKSEEDVAWLIAQILELGTVESGMKILELRVQNLRAQIREATPALTPVIDQFLGYFLEPLRASFRKYQKNGWSQS